VSVFLIIMQIRKFKKDAKRSQHGDKEDTPESSLSSATDFNDSRVSSIIVSRDPSRAATPRIYLASYDEEFKERTVVKQSPVKDQSEIMFENSSEVAAPHLNVDNVNGFVGESTPLLTINKDEIQADMPTADFKFGTLTTNTGLWKKDVSGKSLIRFVILLLLLVFSSFVVREEQH